MDEFAFNDFNDIEHKPLRVYNRVVFMFNIREDFGAYKVQEYLQRFTEAQKKEMYILIQYLNKYGKDATMKAITSNTEFTEDKCVENV
tara:strand:- start:225 stop:488 length:264 start_codon:yes stop_codon:yes gene_type:complete